MPIETRRYGTAGPRVVVLHGGPGAPGSAALPARGLAGAFLLVILIAGVWFVFTARQLHLEIQPEPDRVDVQGGLIAPRLQGYYLLRPGIDRIIRRDVDLLYTIARMARRLDLTTRATPDWCMATGITDTLRRLDPDGAGPAGGTAGFPVFDASPDILVLNQGLEAALDDPETRSLVHRIIETGTERRVPAQTAITEEGVGNPAVLAGGISEALITTAAGLCVAIPSLMGYRYLRGRVDELVVDMEKEAMKLVEALHESAGQTIQLGVVREHRGQAGDAPLDVASLARAEVGENVLVRGMGHLGRGERPQYGRWTYWEKFDYLAVFWGVELLPVGPAPVGRPLALAEEPLHGADELHAVALVEHHPVRSEDELLPGLAFLTTAHVHVVKVADEVEEGQQGAEREKPAGRKDHDRPRLEAVTEQ